MNIFPAESQDYSLRKWLCRKGVCRMIRGINRQIIEISDTQSDYFERALLFVSPDYCDAERAVLEHEARRALKRLGEPTGVRARRKRVWLWGRLVLAAFCGAAVAALGFWLL